MEDNKLIIYKNSAGNIVVDAIYKDETLWLSQKKPINKEYIPFYFGI